jgi:hypothetical protein
MNAKTTASLSKSSKSKLGQNTAEYMLLLLLIGGGSIIAFKTFGTGIMNRFASVTQIIGGGASIKADAVDTTKKIDFTTFDDQEKK